MFWTFLNYMTEFNRSEGEMLNIETISLWMDQFLLDMNIYSF